MVSRSPHLGWEDLLALRAATAPPEAAGAAWRDLMATVAFDEIAESTQRVMPAIFANLRDQPDLPERDRMRGAFKFAWSRTTELLHAARGVLVDLVADGVDHRVLKGAAVQVACGRIGSRLMGDVDLLVRATDVDAVADIMARNEFRRAGHSECSGHSDVEHHAALTFNRGSCHVDVHVAEHKAPRRLLTQMMAAPVRSVPAVGVAVHLPPPELLLLHAAVHGAQADGPTDFVQAVVDVAALAPLVDRTRLVAAARRTGVLGQLLALDAAVRSVGADPLAVDVPASARVEARVDAAVAAVAGAAVGASSVGRRVRDRRRGSAVEAEVRRRFVGDRHAYATWLRSGQFAVAERAAVRLRGGFLPAPRSTWVSGTTASPFVDANVEAGAAGPVPGLTASTVAPDALDWRFRVRFNGPQAVARVRFASAALDRLDVFVFRNGIPVRQIAAADEDARTVVLRDLPASNEFSIRSLWSVCARCYRGLDDLAVRIDLGDDAR